MLTDRIIDVIASKFLFLFSLNIKKILYSFNKCKILIKYHAYNKYIMAWQASLNSFSNQEVTTLCVSLQITTCDVAFYYWSIAVDMINIHTVEGKGFH